MIPKFVRLVAILVLAAGSHAGCRGGGDGGNPVSPSSMPSVVRGTVGLGVFEVAVVHFAVDRAGTLSTSIDWNSPGNDIDTTLLRGRCAVDQILNGATGCDETASIATDASLNKPSGLSVSTQSGDHTLVIFNWGPGADTASYALDGFVSAVTGAETSGGIQPPPAPSPTRRTDTFPFVLPAGSTDPVIVGPVRAGEGPLDVTLAFAGDYVILACIGTASACTPMGGRPSTASFDIPADIPAGSIQARVYFNPNRTQPPRDAMGTVSFTYNPL